ncbi:DUF4249 domain-containing protein [Maribellus maritimus]|uniref:DUF4249 domain-containing protein n=1 Tax=Maribellus maritimus TaxID=2870838 RepID=UPI001EE9D8A6|nr:DUF4249 domain-containing protein [Maribellus maritimus]MCG6188192.1 DUF4249 domain-containing protein [Maribellus maritimus]
MISAKIFRRFLFPGTSIFLFFACISNVDLKIGSENQQFVLNSILDTSKDTVVARLTKTKNITSAESFEAVRDAEIVLFENDKELGHFTYSDSGAYFLVYNPKPGLKYRLEAETGDGKIWGETTVPKETEARFEKRASSIEGYQVSLEDNDDDDNFYWITATGYVGASEHQYKNIACIISSDFEYADDFNRYTSEGTFKFEYDYYLRFSDNQLTDSTSILFRPECVNSPITVFLLSTDYHLDKYMKSSLLLERMDLYAEDTPIIYSPQPVYSNVHGGTGIFGSFTGVSQKFSKD